MVIKTNKGRIGNIDSIIIRKHANKGPYIDELSIIPINNSYNFVNTSSIKKSHTYYNISMWKNHEFITYVTS